MSNLNDAQMAIFDYMVDLLVDMADPPPEEEEDAYDDMVGVTTALMEALSFTVVSVDADTITVTVKVP